MPVVQFGLSTDDRRKLFKQISFSVSADCYIKDNRSIVNPVFVLDYNPAIISLNYAYVSDFGRYYFINNISVAPGGKMEVDCSVDVLQTYNNQIASLSVEVSRQEFLVEPYLPDSNFVYLDTYDVINVLPGNLGSITGNTFDNQDENSKVIVIGIAGGQNEHFDEIPGYSLVESEPEDWKDVYATNYYWNKGSLMNPEISMIITAIIAGVITFDQVNDFKTAQSILGDIYEKAKED